MQKCAHLVDFEKCCQTPNAYFLPKFRFDTAENDPAKKLQTFAKIRNSTGSVCFAYARGARDLDIRAELQPRHLPEGSRPFGKVGNVEPADRQ